jgi:hypothetical protein
MRALLRAGALALVLSGCGGKEAAPLDSGPDLSVCDSSDTQVLLFNTLGFVHREGLVSEGFDLDGRVSDTSDPGGCYQPDLTAPDGTPGIDNALSGLLPALEATEARVLETLIQEFVNRGDILLAIELEDVDSFENDGCVHVNILAATGPVLLGTDGSIAPGQTFDRDPAVPVIRAEHATIEDGVLRIHDTDFRLVVQVAGADIDLTLEHAEFAIRLNPDGTASGILGGGVSVTRLDALIDTLATDVADLAKQLIHTVADLEPTDAGCDAMSVVFHFTTTTAFFYADAPPADDTGATPVRGGMASTGAP